jgi:hypothetical protein
MSELDWPVVLQGDVPINDRHAQLTRRQPDGVLALGASHASVIISPDGLLLGFTKLKRPSAVPTKDEARRCAFEFFAKVANDLDLTELWIAPHEERVIFNGQVETVTGQKVKCRQSDGRYPWVVVGASVFTFEQDIEWNDALRTRATEQWLHDDWLRHRLNGGQLL